MHGQRLQVVCANLVLTFVLIFSTNSLTLAQSTSSDRLSLRSSELLASPPAQNANPAPEQSVSPSQSSVLSQPQLWQNGSAACQTLRATSFDRLTLGDVLERVLCKSPALRQALFNINEQRAGVDLAQSAFGPRYSVVTEYSANRVPNSNITATNSSISGALNLNWILFDFGLRNANLEQARQTFSAVMASQDSSTLMALNDTLRIYAEALSTWGKLDAVREAESAASQSLVIAQARYDAQVGSLTDKLQAQTALAQAVLDRTRAQGLWLSARGALALSMGLPVSQALSVADLDSAFPFLDDLPAIDYLLAQAKEAHPRIRSLRFEQRALQARLESVQADGKGSVSVSGNAGASRTLGGGSSNTTRNLGGAVVASIPLFNEAEQNARTAQVQSQLGSRQAQMQLVESELENEVWRVSQQIRAETESLIAAKQLFTAAQSGYQVAHGRYKAGVGTLVDLLTAQTAVANARTQLQEAKLANVQSRIRLSLVSGRLGILGTRR